MSLFPPECNWVYFSHTQNVSHHILSPSAMVSLSVVEGRPIPTRSPPELSTHFHAASHCSLQRPEWLRNGCTGAVQKECSPPELLAAHDTQLQTWYGVTGTLELARNVYVHTLYDRIFGDFPAKIAVCTPICMALANPRDYANARAGRCWGGTAPLESLSLHCIQLKCKLQRRWNNLQTETARTF